MPEASGVSPARPIPPTKTQLVAADASANDSFGFAVALTYNMARAVNIAVVGAIGKGAAYVFTRSGGGAWTQEAKLTASDGVPGDRFGVSVAVVNDTVMVGCPSRNSVYVFGRSGSGWSQQAKLTASDGQNGFGYSLALSDSLAVIGAWDSSPSAGAAYVFRKSGDSWQQAAKLTSADQASHFGASVAIARDGVVVGAELGQQTAAGGAVYFFDVWDWQQQAKLTAPDGVAFNLFGRAVAASGAIVLVGAPGQSSPPQSPQAVYAFTESQLVWNQPVRLTAMSELFQDGFGTSLAFNGYKVAIGAPATAGGRGIVWIFSTSDGLPWYQLQFLVLADGQAGDVLGSSVAIVGDSVLVGAPASGQGRTGAAYVFDMGQ